MPHVGRGHAVQSLSSVLPANETRRLPVLDKAFDLEALVAPRTGDNVRLPSAQLPGGQGALYAVEPLREAGWFGDDLPDRRHGRGDYARGNEPHHAAGAYSAPR
jgi:hypothetical protein